MRGTSDLTVNRHSRTECFTRRPATQNSVREAYENRTCATETRVSRSWKKNRSHYNVAQCGSSSATTETTDNFNVVTRHQAQLGRKEPAVKEVKGNSVGRRPTLYRDEGVFLSFFPPCLRIDRLGRFPSRTCCPSKRRPGIRGNERTCARQRRAVNKSEIDTWPAKRILVVAPLPVPAGGGHRGHRGRRRRGRRRCCCC
jgi:hypothetical protein